MLTSWALGGIALGLAMQELEASPLEAAPFNAGDGGSEVDEEARHDL
jgi:hypothetical protein